MTASLSSLRQTFERIRAEATMYLPGGKFTMPPPSVLAFSIALLTAAVSLVVPSPVAPKSFTLYCFDSSNFGCGIVGGVKTLSGGSGVAATYERHTIASRAIGARRFMGRFSFEPMLYRGNREVARKCSGILAGPMKRLPFCVALILAASFSHAAAAEIERVRDQIRSAKPGDVIELPPGAYKDVEIVLDVS